MKKKILRLLHNNSGGDDWFDMAIKVVISFVIGGIILEGLSKGFKIEILPSLIAQIKDLLTW